MAAIAISGAWRTSTYSAGGECVEVRRVTGGVEVRDSLDPDGPRLHFEAVPWHEFLTWAARDGESASTLRA